MNTSTRRRLGAVVFLGSVAIAVVLQISGRGFIGYASKVRPMVVWFDISFHWAVLPVGIAALVGLLSWIIPARRTPPRIV
jgi:hypothetical protein